MLTIDIETSKYKELSSGVEEDLEKFLLNLKGKKVNVNLVVGQEYFNKNFETIKKWDKLEMFSQLGVKLIDSSDKRFIKSLSEISKVVIYTTNGVVTPEDVERLSNQSVSVLVLGYRLLDRKYNQDNPRELTERKWELKDYLMRNRNNFNKRFRSFGLDDLAKEQLGM